MPENLAYRIEQAERRVERLERRTENLNVTELEVRDLRTHIDRLSEKVDALNKALYTGAISFVVGALILALSLSRIFG
jgi:prefoldin subunit 5